jgi:type III pantothenate kinase
MILTVDVGNSTIAFGIHGNGGWINHWRLHTDRDKTADEYLVLINTLLQNGGHRLEQIGRIVISSVVPTLTPTITAVAHHLCPRIPPLVVSHELKNGLNPTPPIPPELGSDLLANAVAAFDRTGAGAIIVDFGTALTFEAISDDGRIAGVSIAPGLRSAVEALSSNTAQLPAVDLEPPPNALGRTTVHAIQSGIVYGYVGLIQGLVQRMTTDMRASGDIQGDPQIIATGGFAETFAPLTGIFAVIDQWHTLEGLRVLARLNPPGGE